MPASVAQQQSWALPPLRSPFEDLTKLCECAVLVCRQQVGGARRGRLPGASCACLAWMQ